MAGVTRSRTAAAGVIKSIQRGQTSISSNSNGSMTGSTVTINAVDLSKSFVSVSFANGYGVGNVSNNMTGPYTGPTSLGGYLSNTTTMTLQQGLWRKYSVTYAHSGGTVYWEVIEYE